MDRNGISLFSIGNTSTHSGALMFQPAMLVDGSVANSSMMKLIRNYNVVRSARKTWHLPESCTKKETMVFQRSISRCYVCFKQGIEA